MQAIYYLSNIFDVVSMGRYNGSAIDENLTSSVSRAKFLEVGEKLLLRAETEITRQESRCAVIVI